MIAAMKQQTLSQRLGQASAVLVLACVLAAYAISLRSGTWPPSHPWSGIGLVSLALMHLGLSRRVVGPHRAVLGLALATSATGALFWLASAVLQVAR